MFNFLEEISSLSHSIVFLYFFALTTEEGFLPGHEIGKPFVDAPRYMLIDG